MYQYPTSMHNERQQRLAWYTNPRVIIQNIISTMLVSINGSLQRRPFILGFLLQSFPLLNDLLPFLRRQRLHLLHALSFSRWDHMLRDILRQ